MRARSQFAILWSYQMRRRKEGGRLGEGGPQYLSAALHPISPPVYHARTATAAGPGGPTDRPTRRTRFRYHFPIRLGRAGKVGVVHRDPLRRKLSGESDPLATASSPSFSASSFGSFGGGGFLSALSERQAIINQSDCACHIRSTRSHRSHRSHRTQRWISDAAATAPLQGGRKEGRKGAQSGKLCAPHCVSSMASHFIPSPPIFATKLRLKSQLDREFGVGVLAASLNNGFIESAEGIFSS